MDRFINGLGLELSVFGALCAASVPYHTSPASWLATTAYSYMTAYSISRAVMAYSRIAVLKGSFFEIHRLVGGVCLLYAPIVWYKLVVLRGEDFPIEYQGWFDVAKALGAASTFWNEISGIILFPHVNQKAPLILRQIFTIGTSMGLATYMIFVLIQLRAWYPNGSHLVTAAATLTVLWNILAVSMGLRAAYILSMEKELNAKELQEASRVNAKKKPPINLQSFFYDIFIHPGKYGGTLHTVEGVSYLAYGSKRVAQVVTISTSSAPGIIMGLLAVNLATNIHHMTALSPGVDSNRLVVNFVLTTFEMMAFCVIPGNMLDLTLVLRRRMSSARVALEVPLSFLASMIAPVVLALAMLNSENAGDYVGMLRAMVWPLMGSVTSK